MQIKIQRPVMDSRLRGNDEECDLKQLSLPLRCALALPLLAVAAPVWGQANRSVEKCPDELYEYARQTDSIIHCTITVIGNLPSSSGERTEDIISIEVPDSAYQRIEQSLSEVPGLQQFRRSDARSANPTSQGITLRGLGGNASSRALLFLDDVPQADPFGGWVSWPGYEALNLASIRVRKGGGHVSAGPGALAGLIELDSLQGQEAVTGAFSYGSRNSVEARGGLIRNIGGAGVSLAASYGRSDGFVPIISGQRGLADRRAGYEQGGLSARVVGYLNENTQLKANLRAFSDKRNRGLDFSDSSNGGIDGSLRLIKRSGGWRWSATGYVQLREFSSEFGAVSADRSTVTQTLDQFATPSTGLGLRFEVRPPLGDKAELRLGGEWRRTDGETKELFTFVAGAPTRLRTAGGQTDSYGGFAELSIEPTEALTLSLGGRLDRWRIADGFRREVNIGGGIRSDDRFVERQGTEWTGRAGFGWEASDSLTLRGSAYRGWRLPTLNELYRPFRGATLFWNRLDGAIANVTLGAGPGVFPGVGFVAAGGTYRQRQNLDAIISKGVELDASYDLTDALRFRLGYAYVDAEVRGSGVAAPLNGLRPAQVPRHFGNASLAYDDGRFNAEATLRYIGRQFEDDANSRVLDDALTADMSLGYALDDRLTLELRGENLFNARVEAAVSGAGIIERANPRTIWFGLRYSLD
jgi:vitamin B12 transporter